MTPKQKAKELYLKFHQFTPAEFEFEHEYTKMCAIVCVMELINESSPNVTHSEREGLNDEDYWIQVKTEIENL